QAGTRWGWRPRARSRRCGRAAGAEAAARRGFGPRRTRTRATRTGSASASEAGSPAAAPWWSLAAGARSSGAHEGAGPRRRRPRGAPPRGSRASASRSDPAVAVVHREPQARRVAVAADVARRHDEVVDAVGQAMRVERLRRELEEEAATLEVRVVRPEDGH